MQYISSPMCNVLVFFFLNLSMILLIFILQTTFVYLLTADERNILLKVPVTVSSNYEAAKIINDGENTTNCFKIRNDQVKWVVFDMQNIYQVQRMILSYPKNRNRYNISIYIGYEFSGCYFHKQIVDYKPCKIGVPQSGERIEFDCSEGSPNAGQYLAIVKGDFSSAKKDENDETLNLCEVEAYGKLIPNKKIRVKPTISSEPLPEIIFKILQEVRKGVPSITIPAYSNKISYINENCEPIIWDKETKSAFSLACQTPDNKGRIMVFGKNNFFMNTLKDKELETFKGNILKWLSPGTKDPTVIESDSLETIDMVKKTVKQGDIINFDVWSPTKKDILQELKSLLLKGVISIVIDHTFWAEKNKEARISYMEILDIFNVDFSKNKINWSTVKTLNLSLDDVKDDLVDIERSLERMLKNHDFFLKNGKDISLDLLQYSFLPLSRSKAQLHLNKIIKKYDDLLKWICPCKFSPATDQTERAIIEILGNLLKSQLLIKSNYKAPCVDLFPGDFTTSPVKKSVTITLEGQYDSTYSPIGYYLEPGATLDYKVSQINGKWDMTIGCHTDTLDERRTGWYRYPSVCVNRVPLEISGSIYSPFGGVILLYNSEKNQTITISLSNIVSTPFFNIREKSSVSKWELQKNNPGLWAIVAGDSLMFCVESSLIRSFNGEYLQNLMSNHWDMIVRMDLSFKSENWTEKKPEIVVLDIMISAGYGHSGYPIVVHDDWFDDAMNVSLIQSKGSWGLCHEIGHNMQEGAWTFDGAGEVTNNLFCLYNYHKLWQLPYYGSNEIKIFRGRDKTPEIKTYLDKGADFETWKSEPFTALLIYAQMANHFGWGFYNKVFDFYKNNEMSLKTDDDEMAMWMNVTSIITQQNLIPMFDFWGFPINQEVKASLSSLPCFFPDDFYKEISEIRTKYINSKYESCSSESSFHEDFPLGRFRGELRPNFIKEIQ